MNWIELFSPTARQLAHRQRDQAQRLALEHAARHERLVVEAEHHVLLAEMYRDRAERINTVLSKKDTE
jgi:hypothetical protein